MEQVFLHGLGQTAESWEGVVRALGLEGGCVCPDLGGLLRGREATYGNMYAGLLATCGSGGEALALCGLSLGGVLALNFAVDHPERVGALALVAPQYKMPRGLLRAQNLLFRAMPRSAFRDTRMGKEEFLRLCGSMMELDFSGVLGRIGCPVLVVCGERDRANRRACEELAERLENARLEIIPSAGHEVNVEAPDALARVLREFYGLPGAV